MTAAPAGGAHLPEPSALDAYGNGGFRFAGMSHRGSILCLPSGIWGWPPTTSGEIDPAALARVVEEASRIDLLLVGTGPEPVPLGAAAREALRDAGIRHDVMATGPAARTYNVLFAERRRVAAALIAVP